MKYTFSKIFVFLAICISCVEPNEISLGGNSEWVVYGLMGEDKPPVVFVYGVTLTGSQLIYNYEAKITIKDKMTQEEFLLYPAINEMLNRIGTNEFPFGVDVLNNIVFYTSEEFIPQEGHTYEVNFDLGEEKGKAELEMPNSIPFSNVEMVTNNNGVSRLLMSIADEPEMNYYKWEVKVDQTIAFSYSEIDSTSGDTVVYNVSQDFDLEFLPNNYIREETISESENIFRLNLSASLIDYESVDETYYLNVRLRHYGKEVVDYFESLIEQNSGNLYDPFIEPVAIKSNINGIIGLLGTYSYSEPVFLEYQP